ncbi:hypothetical protein LOD99_9078 [Oopsacas minuta]|uniref:Fucosyltransferase n=1 Tax=Oopsacas minuta TaxID=111878 RepID=A0AAV7JEA9_9METZ|nr:hypothetical protein LOD99_9078 [Oopsacas minuta]
MRNQLFIYLILTSLFITTISIRILVKPEIFKRDWPFNGDLNFSKDWSDECDVPCVWTGRADNIDGVFYTIRHNKDARWAFDDAKLAAITIGGATEPEHYHPLLTNENFWKYFTASALLATGSDIPWILKVSSYEEIQKVQPITDPIRKGVIGMFNCKSFNNREKILKEMMKIFPIASIGLCVRTEPWPMCGSKECDKEHVLRKYMFCLAFENGDTPGFVSEKIHQCFRAGSLPVWYGTKDVAWLLPKGSYIDMGDFESHIQLAHYLVHVMNNVTLYNSYFEWKKHPLDPAYVERNAPFWNYKIQCRVCRYVSVIQRGLTWDKTTQNAEIGSSRPIYPEIDIKVQYSSDILVKSFEEDRINYVFRSYTDMLVFLSLFVVIFLVLHISGYTKGILKFLKYRRY